MFQRKNSNLEDSQADNPAPKISHSDKDQRWKFLEKGEKPGKMQNIGYTKSYLIGLQKYFFEPLHLIFRLDKVWNNNNGQFRILKI